MHQLHQMLTLTFIAFILTACGGGGSSPSSSTANSSTNTLNTATTASPTSTTSSSTPTVNSSTVTTNTPNTTVTTASPTSTTSSSTPTVNSSTVTTNILTPSLQKVALDNMGNNVQKPFNEYEIKVLSDKNLTESDETSHETIAVYGTINSSSTKALLKINSHYRESNLTVEVYKNDQLLATKKELPLTNQVAVDFGQIEIK